MNDIAITAERPDRPDASALIGELEGELAKHTRSKAATATPSTR